MSVDLRQAESLDTLIEAIERWEEIAGNLRSDGVKIMVAEHLEFLNRQLDRHLTELGSLGIKSA